MAKDWLTDDSLSDQEKLERFELLNPEPTRGPKEPTRSGQGGFVVRQAKKVEVTGAVIAPQVFRTRDGASSL